MKFMVYVDVWFYALSPVNWSLDFMASHQESWQINISTHPRLNIDSSHTQNSIFSTQGFVILWGFHIAPAFRRNCSIISGLQKSLFLVQLPCPVQWCPALLWHDLALALVWSLYSTQYLVLYFLCSSKREQTYFFIHVK